MHHLFLVVTPEVVRSEFIVSEIRLLGDCSGETAFVKWNSRDHSDVALLGEREEIGLRGLIENVVDYLDGIDETGLYDFERRVWLVVVDGYTHETDFAGFLDVFEASLPFVFVYPFRIPDVQLL